METNKRNFERDRPEGKKKVCFAPGGEVLDYIEGYPDGKDDNDLDLDTLAPSKGNRRVKEDLSGDEEETRSGSDDEDRIDGRDDDVIAPPKIDSDSSGEEAVEPDSEGEESQEKFTPFNMRQEREEGDFDDGEDEYRWKGDNESYQDKWLEGISKAEMRRAKDAEELKARQLEANLNPHELTSSLQSYLQQGETPMQAIQRRNAGLPIKKIGQRQKNTASYTPGQLEGHAKARRDIEEITSLATKLLDLGRLNVYDLSRESL